MHPMGHFVGGWVSESKLVENSEKLRTAVEGRLAEVYAYTRSAFRRSTQSKSGGIVANG
jgi:hypothetical protein